MSIDRGMDKDVVHIQLNITQPEKKKNETVICRDVDGNRAYYAEWGMSEREKYISYINAYIWNLERWYWWTYMQGNNGDADIGNRCVDTVGEGKRGTNWESSMETCTFCSVLWSRSVVSDSLLHPWDSPGKNTGVGYHFLLQGIFTTQGLNLGLPHCRQTL